MNTLKKVVYVLVSNHDDYYTEMAILSITCVKRYSPNLIVELVMNQRTFDSLKGYRKTLLDVVDELHVIDLFEKNNAFTSRFIKTQLRSFIIGDYLYVDIDAVPIASLDNIFLCKNDLAMAHDHNVPPEKFIYHDYEREIFDKMGWELPKKYFNSGVMLVKDNARVHSFFNTWHELWQQNSQFGLHKDQPPMHEAIRQCNISVYSLGPECNMLIGLQTGYGAKKAKVYHYSTIRFETRDDTYFHKIVKSMKSEEKIDFDLLEKVIKNKYPWTNDNSLRLNLAVGNYHKLPKLIIKKLF